MTQTKKPETSWFVMRITEVDVIEYPTAEGASFALHGR